MRYPDSFEAYVGTDMPRELPIPVRNVNMAFHDDPEHYAMSGTRAWAEWNEIRPPGKGYIFLGDAYYPFGVSMWHQIHCLNHIRTMFVNGDDGSDHTEHCFHYLRQALLCAADTTLEYGGPSMRSPNGDVIATGVNVTHTCRDWKQVHDYMEEEHGKWTPEMVARMKDVSDGTNNHAI
ncbi:hypothetical protein CVT25_013268 [Psilocybe cyanescens]|uniref:Oxidase ustYa n=1 Tax=Psilocybe cyanescens TaxID=93625 RepID=A0A409XK46_PSICY|nr:hypothetical protein CVT25_013268 [Psilocybe cyanescens]